MSEGCERLRAALLRLVEAVEGDRRHGDRQSWAELQASLIDARAMTVVPSPEQREDQ